MCWVNAGFLLNYACTKLYFLCTEARLNKRDNVQGNLVNLGLKFNLTTQTFKQANFPFLQAGVCKNTISLKR